MATKRTDIKIKPENRGKFTKRANAAGMSVQAYANKVLNNPSKYSEKVKDEARFAKNIGGAQKRKVNKRK